MARFLNFTVVKETPRMCFRRKKKKTLEEEIYFLKERFQDEAVFLGPGKYVLIMAFREIILLIFLFSEFSDPFHGLGNL